MILPCAQYIRMNIVFLCKDERYDPLRKSCLRKLKPEKQIQNLRIGIYLFNGRESPESRNYLHDSNAEKNTS